MRLRRFLSIYYAQMATHFIFLCLIEGLLYIFEVNRYLMIYLLVISILLELIYLGQQYMKKFRYYKDVTIKLDMLDQKNMLSEMMERPDFFEGEFIYDILQSCNKSMNDEILQYRTEAAGYREYIEMWIHEVKTPLAAAKLILENHPSEITEAMDEALQQINYYLEQALYYARSNSVEKDYLVKELNLKDMVQKAVRSNARIMISNKIKISMNNLDQKIFSDEKWLLFILNQIISNAVKYTASGGRVTIRITELDCDRKDYVRIRTQVIDTGIGMSEEFLPSLFEAFARERNTTDGKIAGTGLGMPIIKKYVDMMGGTIKAESKLGEGSKFTVIMEYRIADKSYYEQDTEKSSDVDETDRISGKHILLAEDNDLNAEIAQFILEDMGLMVDRVEDGVQCVSRIEQKPAGTYDLILMDIQMPNMDGYRATEMIRGLSDKDKATIPIIAMTANAFEEDRKKALAKGMNGHIAKPVDAEKVEKTICSVLGSQSEQ